jgi:hypothetical protein
MKKILSIVLGLALVLSLSLATATSVGATVQNVSCNVTPDTVNTAANYTIVFNITSTLAIGATISIEFPSDTWVPTTYATGVVTVEGTDISSGDISVSGRVVTITLPEAIGAPKGVTVFFHEAAGIKNPTTKGYYNLWVKTSKETTWVDCDDDYTIRLADNSTYEFIFAVPEIWENEPAEVDVTLQTDVLGLDGYDYVQIVFNVTEQPQPSAVTFNVSYLGGWYPTSNSGTWPPSGGNFSVTEDYMDTIHFKLTFNTVGVYTIKFVLKDVDADKVLVEKEIGFAATGVSHEVKLNNGWNLMSLPIVPDENDIEVVLADIMDDVISVHYYRATTGTWLVYIPDEYWPNPLTTMEDGKAYWINMIAAHNLTVVGQAISEPGSGSPPSSYSVLEGWNMVGFRSMNPMTAGDYLKETNWVRIYGFDITQGGWFSRTESQNMTSGLGYWVAFSEPGIIYP